MSQPPPLQLIGSSWSAQLISPTVEVTMIGSSWAAQLSPTASAQIVDSPWTAKVLV